MAVSPCKQAARRWLCKSSALHRGVLGVGQGQVVVQSFPELDAEWGTTARMKFNQNVNI